MINMNSQNKKMILTTGDVLNGASPTLCETTTLNVKENMFMSNPSEAKWRS